MNGMANVGVKPSFNNSKNAPNVEVHIFDFDGDLYSREIIVNFIKKTRDEKKFATKEDLIQQLGLDEKCVRKILR